MLNHHSCDTRNRAQVSFGYVWHSCQPSRNSLDCPGNGQCVPLSRELGVLSRVFGFPRSPISAGHIPVFCRSLACMDRLVFVPPRACRISKVWSAGCSCFRELELVSRASRIFPTCTHARMTSAPHPLVIRVCVHVDGWPARLSSNYGFT